MKSVKRFYLLYLSNLRVTSRVKIVLFFTIIFPLVFIGIFGIAFQAGDPSNTTIDLAVVNFDSRIPDDGNVYRNISGIMIADDYYSQSYLDILSTVTFEDNKTLIFEITQFNDIDSAMKRVEKRDYGALLVIPENFTTATLASRRSLFEASIPFDWSFYPLTNYTTVLSVRGDSTLVSYTIASTVIQAVTKGFFTLNMVEAIGATVSLDGTLTTSGLTVFDYTVPGLVIFAILSNLGTVTSSALRDMREGQFDRLKLTKMRASEYLLAIILSQLTVSVIQIPLMFAGAILFGFPISIKLLYAFIFGLLVSLSVSGIGILLAAFVRSIEAASALTGIVSTPMAFLAGAFFTMPNPALIPAGSILGSHEFGVFDLIPARPAITALRVVLLTDQGMAGVWYEFWLTTVLVIFYMILGIYLFSRKHLRAR